MTAIITIIIIIIIIMIIINNIIIIIITTQQQQYCVRPQYKRNGVTVCQSLSSVSKSTRTHQTWQCARLCKHSNVLV